MGLDGVCTWRVSHISWASFWDLDAKDCSILEVSRFLQAPICVGARCMVWSSLLRCTLGKELAV